MNVPAANASREVHSSSPSTPSTPTSSPGQMQSVEPRWGRMAPPGEQHPTSQAREFRGKHRRRADLNRLNQEIRFLEEELEGLEKTDLASTACKDMMAKIDNTSDPLLPFTKGPSNPAWDRWFERPTETQSCCWIG
eukprot:c16727_g1_i1 orf=326-733(+)